MIRTLIILFLLLTTLCAHADEKLAKWEFDDPLRKELGGRYFGPGIAYLDLIKCSIKVSLLSNEYVHYTYHKSGGLMLIHAVEKKPRDYTLNLGLGCYTGGSLERIKKDFTRPDGSYGMSETHRQWGEENQIKVGVRLFKRITWQGIGNVKNIVDFEFPGQYTEFCLFSTTTKTPQA
ncbi:hypothetical protein [Sapientia aquatica]|uniref:Uncharacterized protein n=1 Tax=Sapientia aquatica TaxID=1549640 RepID=A0A4R5VUC9_9BURK|nr:hypothetical protein [Sapientia aquatica]TDK62718.1 hypothetical protein E2I14_15535 [Sapientia aquatica]